MRDGDVSPELHFIVEILGKNSPGEDIGFLEAREIVTAIPLSRLTAKCTARQETGTRVQQSVSVKRMLSAPTPVMVRIRESFSA